MGNRSDPPFYRYAAKTLAAVGLAVVGASATILAAVDDDRVTTSEVVAIVLAVLAGIAGPAAVYKARNALRPGDGSPPAIRLMAAAPADGSAAAQRAYPSPKPPPEPRAAADPWTAPDEP